MTNPIEPPWDEPEPDDLDAELASFCRRHRIFFEGDDCGRCLEDEWQDRNWEWKREEEIEERGRTR